MKTTAKPLSEEAIKAVDFAESALAVAGHEVTDPWALEQARLIANQEKSIDEVIAEAREQFDC